MFQTKNAVRSNNQSLKYQRFTLLDCKDKEFRKFGFVAKTQILKTLFVVFSSYFIKTLWIRSSYEYGSESLICKSLSERDWRGKVRVWCPMHNSTLEPLTAQG